MRRPALIWLLIAGLFVGMLLVPAAPSYAWRHDGGRVFVGVGVGPGFWWGPPWWGPPYPYYWYPPYYYPPPQQPQVYVQQVPAPAPPGDWYYCKSAGEYYPQVQNCPEPWIQVPTRSP
jgi:hypothetical protein